jgi:hypothetical protein
LDFLPNAEHQVRLRASVERGPALFLRNIPIRLKVVRALPTSRGYYALR